MLTRVVGLFLYYTLGKYLPRTDTRFFGRFSKSYRYFCGKLIFTHCGRNVNIDRLASFGSGKNVIIGDNSGIGYRCYIPSTITIGNDVMMAPFVYIHGNNHNYKSTDIPMNKQGVEETRMTTIEDDVWIGSHVIVLPGKRIAKGSIVATGTVLTKNFPKYSIIGGNPAKLIKSREE